jgi:hypothetical protein
MVADAWRQHELCLAHLDRPPSSAHETAMRWGLFILGHLAAISASRATADEQPICPDRPSKSTGPCTVPQGRWQIETGIVDWSRERSDGVTTDATAWGNTAIKYGVSGNADVELWVTPLETLGTHGSGVSERHSSFGDILLRVKYELTPDNAPVQVALDPFVKIPTANHWLGNRRVEGGLLVPVAIPVGKSPFMLSLDPEFDLLADEDGHGRHLATQQVINLGIALSQKVSVSTELWGQWDWDPSGTGKQASWDLAAGYQPTKNMQLDAGANFGLNRQTPGVEVYTGVSVRF